MIWYLKNSILLAAFLDKSPMFHLGKMEYSTAHCNRLAVQRSKIDREQKFQIQQRLETPDRCSQDTLYKSLKQKLVRSFSRVPLFRLILKDLNWISSKTQAGYWTLNWMQNLQIAMVHFLDHHISGTQLMKMQDSAPQASLTPT